MAWWEFHPRGGDWPSARECHTMHVLDDQVVLFGGNDQTSRMNDIHVLDPSECVPRGGRKGRRHG